MAEDQTWVFDSLVCFLHGPIWNAPIQNFIEEKSIVFDPNEKHDENDKEIKKLHEEFKNLVDFMLGSFMDELQITPVQFEVACLEGRNSGNVSDASGMSKAEDDGSFSFHQGLFQQIWAANDIRIFVKMMVQRNLEIQLQALDLIERRQTSSNKSNEDSSSIDAFDVPNEGLYNNGQIPDEILLPEKNEVLSTKTQIDEENINTLVGSHDVENILGANVQNESNDYDMNEKFKRLNLFFENEKVDTQEIKQRQEYLRAQRDKILSIKKQVRAKQLNETVNKTGRPQSASAAAAKILIQEGNTDDLVTDAKHESSKQLRFTLAKRLKAEIIDANIQN